MSHDHGEQQDTPATEDPRSSEVTTSTGATQVATNPATPERSDSKSSHSELTGVAEDPKKDKFSISPPRPVARSRAPTAYDSVRQDFGLDPSRSTATFKDVEKTESAVAPLGSVRTYEYEKLAQKHPGPTDHLSITIGPPIILLLDLIVPCIIYYTWYNSTMKHWRNECRLYDTKGSDINCPLAKPEFDKDILGYAIVSFGFGEIYILIARVWRLWAHTDECAPLLSRSRWELDATSWVYAVAMIVALIPFVTGSSLEIPELYLYGPAFLMTYLGFLMVITLVPFKIPIGINSHPKHTPLRPFIYYAAEDFIAVDGLQDRDFRVRYNERYKRSPGFRKIFFYLTLWWMFGILVYIGCLSAVIWTLPFHYAFGLSLGILFSYILLWACTSYVYVNVAMDQERKKFERDGHFEHANYLNFEIPHPATSKH